ncbi:MAG: hypothetical protein JWM74_4345 [Myxococcaceae bacterium]|nr:hypothetical protein [Myxococcaceae bacterium]
MRPRSLRSMLSLAFLALAAITAPACGPGGDANNPSRTPLADKWLARAQNSYRQGDFEDAQHAGKAALEVAPRDHDIRLINARISLARLEYAQALKLTEGMQSTDAHAIRGRAFWYSGDLEQAADALEAALRDPAVKDPWAREIAALARRGTGRHPFQMEGGLVAPVDMPPAGPALVVPCELEGERILAMIATGSGEVIIDSNSRREAAWVNMKFGDRIEVKDIPALTQDLSGLSRQLGAPVKALLGVNLLRHLHVTFDRRGDQFVVRRSDPPAPPEASRVPLWYVRGGGMMMRATVSPREDGGATLLVDSSQPFLLALNDSVWKKSGFDMRNLRTDPSIPNLKTGVLPQFRIGGFDLPGVPAVQGASMEPLQQNIDVELGGVMGAGLVSAFRITLGDEGRFAWLEPDPALSGPTGRDAGGPPSTPPPGAAPAPEGLTMPAPPAPPPPSKPTPAKPAPEPKK